MLILFLLTPLSEKDVSVGDSVKYRSVTVVNPPEMIMAACLQL